MWPTCNDPRRSASVQRVGVALGPHTDERRESFMSSWEAKLSRLVPVTGEAWNTVERSLTAAWCRGSEEELRVRNKPFYFTEAPLVFRGLFFRRISLQETTTRFYTAAAAPDVGAPPGV